MVRVEEYQICIRKGNSAEDSKNAPISFKYCNTLRGAQSPAINVNIKMRTFPQKPTVIVLNCQEVSCQEKMAYLDNNYHIFIFHKAKYQVLELQKQFYVPKRHML